MQLGLLLFFAWASTLPDDGVDMLHYDFEIKLFDHSDRIEGQSTFRFMAEQDMDTLVLDLVGKQEDGSGMEVVAASMVGHKLTFFHDKNRLSFHFKQPLQAHHVYELTIAYSGQPGDGLIISKNRHGSRTFFADNWPNRAHHWIPCIDHPGDKATSSFLVEAPKHYRVVANGELIEEKTLGDQRVRTRWASQVEMPTKVMVIGAARFAVQHLEHYTDVPLSSWVFPEEEEKGFKGFAVAAPVMAYFTDYIGPFPYAKLANVQSRTKYGGMENAGAIFYNERVFDRNADGLVAHEIAHQWFGDSVSESDWPHIWLSEGFATYFSWRYMAHQNGPQSMLSNLQRAQSRILRYAEKNPNKTVVRRENVLKDYLGAYSYQKGAYVLHMLQQKVGEARFKDIIRTYYRRYRDGNADTARFQAIAEEISAQDLDVFFKQWLYKPGQPSLKLSWKNDIEHGLVLRCQQDGNHFFDLNLPVRIEGKGGTQNRTVHIQKADQTFTFPGIKAKHIIVNPERTILMDQMSVTQTN